MNKLLAASSSCRACKHLHYTHLYSFMSLTGALLSSLLDSLVVQIMSLANGWRCWIVTLPPTHKMSATYPVSATNSFDLQRKPNSFSCKHPEGIHRNGVHNPCKIVWSILQCNSTFPQIIRFSHTDNIDTQNGQLELVLNCDISCTKSVHHESCTKITYLPDYMHACI